VLLLPRFFVPLSLSLPSLLLQRFDPTANFLRLEMEAQVQKHLEKIYNRVVALEITKMEPYNGREMEACKAALRAWGTQFLEDLKDGLKGKLGHERNLRNNFVADLKALSENEHSLNCFVSIFLTLRV